MLSSEKTHSFTLILSGAKKPTSRIENALFEAHCDDALLGCRNGILFLEFDRQANSLHDAVLSAIAAVEAAGVGLRVERVDPDDLVSAADIARRAGISRESVRHYSRGSRGPGGFPAPAAGVKSRSPRWPDVVEWLVTRSPVSSRSIRVPRTTSCVAETVAVGSINAFLNLRRHATAAPIAIKVLRALPSSLLDSLPFTLRSEKTVGEAPKEYRSIKKPERPAGRNGSAS
jgi:hypothetical protein